MVYKIVYHDVIRYLYVSISVTELQREDGGALLIFIFSFMSLPTVRKRRMIVLCRISRMHVRAKAFSVEAVIEKSSKVRETALDCKDCDHIEICDFFMSIPYPRAVPRMNKRSKDISPSMAWIARRFCLSRAFISFGARPTQWEEIE